MADAVADKVMGSKHPVVRRVDMDQPWSWLAAGWRDLWRAPALGLTYGLVFAVIGAVLTWIVIAEEVYYLTFPLMAGFLLVGPIVAAGLYETSRRLGAGEPPAAGAMLAGLRRNPSQIAFFGVILLLFNIAWVRLASLLFMLYFSDGPPPVDPAGFLEAVISIEAIPFLIIGNVIGAVLAALVFAISAVSIPLLVDRPDANVFTAVVASWQAVTHNKATMFLWAWLIVLFIGIGVATAFIGLIVTLPLIGHATWAAYRDTIEWPDEGAEGEADK